MSFEYDSNLNRIESLDTVRGIAALMVVFFHSPIPCFQFEFGWMGVNLFFILSGFLITNILMDIKRRSFKKYLGNFYLRRVLRIFPLYFLYLLLAFVTLLFLQENSLMQNGNLRQAYEDLLNNYPYLLTFTYNWGSIINFFTGNDYHNSVLTGHLWTLSVEVQFYALFALIMYFMRPQLIKILCVLTIFIVPLLRLLMVLCFEEKHFPPFWIGTVLYNNTLLQTDSLATGCCLALFDFKRLINKGKTYLLLLVGLMVIIGTIHIIVLGNRQIEISSLGYDLPVYHISKQPSPYFILNNRYFYTIPIINLTFGLLTLLLIKRKIENSFWTNRFLMRIGHISYGIYIYHLALGYGLVLLLKMMFHKPVHEFNCLYQTCVILFYLVILLLIASLSYKRYEKRFLNGYTER
jgi:peptidoglycan/LPS O-acetylase OafA/YrhL